MGEALSSEPVVALPGRVGDHWLTRGVIYEVFTRQFSQQGTLDAVYDYPWYHALRRVLRGRELSLLWDKHHQFSRRFPSTAQRMRFVDNHDQRRAASYFGTDGALAGATLLLCGEGVPLIYNGQELGDEAPSRAPALFRRHPIRRDRARPGFERHYRQLIALRRQTPTLERGDTVPLPSKDSRILCFARTLGDQTAVVAVNLGPEADRLTVEHPTLGPATAELSTSGLRAGSGFVQGRQNLHLDGWGWRIWTV